ncbi:hypothetical protein ACIHCQ_35940 [Streptomyces sp. NPDC052236]|uniref:hypothetical protein n=1 Tax=Streptomyces sp. NPDC052236 TaxID=3365686 RepID=UPI0037D09B8B
MSATSSSRSTNTSAATGTSAKGARSRPARIRSDHEGDKASSKAACNPLIASDTTRHSHGPTENIEPGPKPPARLTKNIEAPPVGPGCRLSGGRWFSYYDGAWVTAASGPDVDHMTPLAEAWDSGLVAVTARSNRAKADKDPTPWIPPLAEVRCRYAAEWTGTKLRWNLAADKAEQAALRDLAQACPGTTVTYQPAP